MKLKITSNKTTDAELAEEALHTNSNTFSSWKNTTGLIPIETLVDFCDEYDVSLDWLLRDKKNKTDKTACVHNSDDFKQVPYFYKINSCKVDNCDPDVAATQHIHLPSAVIPPDLTGNKIFAMHSLDNQLPFTAPKHSTIFFNKSDIGVNTYPELFLVKIAGQISIKKIYQRLDLKYCVCGENKEVREEILKIDEIMVIAKYIGAIKWKH